VSCGTSLYRPGLRTAQQKAEKQYNCGVKDKVTGGSGHMSGLGWITMAAGVYGDRFRINQFSVAERRSD
jgi:hypothetical protein